MKYKKIIISIIISLLIIAGTYYFFTLSNITNYPSKGTDIIAFGDSLVLGVGSTKDNDFVSLLSRKIGRPIINISNSGDTTEDGVNNLGKLDKYNPKVVIILLGGNDSLKKVPTTDTYKNLSIIIENIQSRGAVVLLLGVRGGLFTDVFNKEFKNLRDTYHTAFVSDVLSGLLGDMRYMSDTVHPNDKGYQIIAERVYPVLLNIIE